MQWQRLTVLNRLRLTQLITASSALAVAASVLVASPSAAQQSSDASSVLIVDPSATVTFTGSGWGHGVGMSQWGAYARTLAGHGAQDILGFYYPGTVLTENYGRPAGSPSPAPTPTPTAPTPVPTTSSTATPTAPEDQARILLATTDTTTLTPEGINRITIDNQDVAFGGQDAVRAPAGSPITFTHHDDHWHISYNGVDVCGNGCVGQTAQLHFATDTAVAVSTTGRSYSHGRINLIALASAPSRFHITIDSLIVEKFLDDPHNDPAAPGSLGDRPEGSIQIVLAAAEATTLTPEGLNRITVDGQNITHTGLEAVRAPAGTAVLISRVGDRWRIRYGNVDICGSGCTGQTAQLHFGTDTAVAVSTTGRSYSHGRINLIAVAGDPSRFRVVLDSLTIEKFFSDPHSALPAPPGGTTPTTPEAVFGPAAAPVHPEDAIRVHLSTTTGTTLTPLGANRITVDGQGDFRVPAGSSVAVTRHVGHWHFTINGTDVCGDGCTGQTAQLHFATGTSVRVSNTGRSYSHGRINLVPSGGDPGSFYVILDSLSMERYLRGIAETPMNWPLTAHEAQAIAARSYASATLRERRASSSWTRPFDLYSTVWDQAFVGDTREKHASAGTWLQAVANTAGQVLFYQGTPIRAFYSSSNGGHTERSGYVFSADLPFLVAKPDDFDTHQDNPNATWSSTYSVRDFNQWLNDHPDTAVGQLISMTIAGGVGQSGRVDKASIQIAGTSRTVTVTGSRLQSRINTAARERNQPQLLSTKLVFNIPAPGLPGQPTPPGETPVDNAKFYSGVITGPDFCLNRSLGGPTTYAFDSDGDGVADICALPRTRREAAARQQAMEDMAILPGFRDHFISHLAEECLSVPETLGEPDREAADECEQYRGLSANAPGGTAAAQQPNQTVTTPATVDGGPADTYGNGLFYSGIITGPDFCLNRSLGGPTTYAFDSDGDGVADICALPRTRREAAARQQALERLAQDSTSEFSLLFQLACVKGPKTLGEPENEINDECQKYRSDTPA